jgi:hypothetical protein
MTSTSNFRIIFNLFAFIDGDFGCAETERLWIVSEKAYYLNKLGPDVGWWGATIQWGP